MKAIFATLIITLSICGTSAKYDGPVSLLERLVKVLNQKDEAAVKKFVAEWTTVDVPAAARGQRMFELAVQGAPFKIDGEPKVEGYEVATVLVDREGTRLNIRMKFVTQPSLRMKSMRLAPGGVPAVENWTDIGELAKAIASREQSPAMGIALIREGKISVAVTGVRQSGGKSPVKADDCWSIGSIGKPLCTTVIGLLIEQGKLRWDETLKEALPNVPMKPAYEAVTLEQIMHHRGGIPQDEGFEQAMIKRIVGSRTDPVQIRDSYARDILGRDPISKPGERFAYSNAGFALLGHIAEQTAGKPYETLVREMIFRPLGLRHSYTGMDKLPEAKVSGHMPGPGGITPANFAGPLEFLVAPAGGGMWMSVGDLATFGAEHLKGLQGKNGMLKAATIERLHRGIAEEEGGMRYACGWGIESIPGIETFHGHNGSNGTMRAQLCIFPKSGIVVAAIVNRGGEKEPSPGLAAAVAIARRYAPAKG